MKVALPVKMADAGENFTVSRRCFNVWYFGVLRLLIGLAQIVAVIWCTVLLWKGGFDARTMRAVFIGAGITTLSLLLFKVLGNAK